MESLVEKRRRDMKVVANRGIARILKAEGCRFVTLFPACRINNDIGDEGEIPLIMMRDERYAVAVADAIPGLETESVLAFARYKGGSMPRGSNIPPGRSCRPTKIILPCSV